MPSVPVKVSFSALITSRPPSTCAFTVRSVYVSSSLLPQPFPPISKDHLLESTAEPLGPSNSSLHARLHTAGLLANAVGPTGRNEPRIAVSKQVNTATIVVLAVNSFLLERDPRTFLIFI